jgi:plasmid maintenance system antidote protein VapI
MAVRLSIALDTTAESWLNQQAQYDLWQIAQRRKRLKVNRLVAA